MSSASFHSTWFGTSNLATRRRICSSTTRTAGPEQNADAMNRGARIEEFQNGRLASPL